MSSIAVTDISGIDAVKLIHHLQLNRMLPSSGKVCPPVYDQLSLWLTQLEKVLVAFLNMSSCTSPSEGVNKIEIRVEEAGGILQLRVVTDVLVQNGDCRPLDQLPAGTHFR